MQETDPLLNFTALEAYAYYIKVCDKSLVMAMLPPGLLDPGEISYEARSVPGQLLLGVVPSCRLSCLTSLNEL